jgi:hypothetical protein
VEGDEVSGTRSDPLRARRVIEARLNREPQDMLEAAVVLEAWAGAPAQRALETARALMPRTPSKPQPSVATLPPPRRQPGLVIEGAAFVMAVIAIAFWSAPLASSLGAVVVERALTVALPLTLALQWGLRSRYLGRPKGLAELGRRRRMLLLGACGLVALPSALLGLTGMVAGLLTLTWIGGTLLIRRRWPALYVGVVVLATLAMLGGLPAPAVLGATAGACAVAVAAALRPDRIASRATPGRWSRALGGGLLGAGLGLMLVADPSVSWADGTVPALALLPSTVASLWGGSHLWKLEHALPRALSGIAVGKAHARVATWTPLRTLLGAVGRLVWLTAALSAGLLLLTPGLHSSPSGAGVLVGFGLLALATLLVSLLESMGRGRWAAIAVACGVAAEALVNLDGTAPFPGAGLVAGGGLAVVGLLPGAVALLSRPATTLATTLWIK